MSKGHTKITTKSEKRKNNKLEEEEEQLITFKISKTNQYRKKNNISFYLSIKNKRKTILKKSNVFYKVTCHAIVEAF